MDRLIAQGKITYVGSSNFAGWHITRMNEVARMRHALGLVSEQSLYNLLERRVELEVLPACRAYGVGLIPWSPLAGGLLAGSTESQGRRQSPELLASRRRHAGALGAFENFCKELSETPSTIALAWLLHQAGVSATIIGPASVAQLEAIAHVPDITLSEPTLASLNEIFPACGQAPEAYAW